MILNLINILLLVYIAYFLWRHLLPKMEQDCERANREVLRLEKQREFWKSEIERIGKLMEKEKSSQ